MRDESALKISVWVRYLAWAWLALIVLIALAAIMSPASLPAFEPWSIWTVLLVLVGAYVMVLLAFCAITGRSPRGFLFPPRKRPTDGG